MLGLFDRISERSTAPCNDVPESEAKRRKVSKQRHSCMHVLSILLRSATIYSIHIKNQRNGGRNVIYYPETVTIVRIGSFFSSQKKNSAVVGLKTPGLTASTITQPENPLLMVTAIFLNLQSISFCQITLLLRLLKRLPQVSVESSAPQFLCLFGYGV